ncbi:MAG: preprotein translocase subunit SecY, partial [Thermoleophilum sp.]|nr:preprotein translocase subunit SecY [Thermoleophilum sp.]
MLGMVSAALRVPEIRKKLLFTAAMLALYRLGSQIPTPGINTDVLEQIQGRFQAAGALGLANLLTGGGLSRFSIFALGIMPYITASIILKLLTVVVPRLELLKKEGQSGQAKITQYTRYLTLGLAILQSSAFVALARTGQLFGGACSVPVIPENTELGLPLTLVTLVITMTAGTGVVMWLGELITERGIGNGISIIIFGGIIAGYPQTVGRAFLAAGGGNYFGLIFYILILLATVVLIVYFTEAHRRIPVQYAKSVFRGGRMYRQSGSTHIPLRVNTAGMIPLIFAMSVVLFPGIIATYFMGPSDAPNFANTIYNWFRPDASLPVGFFYWGLYFLLTIGFAFFYT